MTASNENGGSTAGDERADKGGVAQATPVPNDPWNIPDSDFANICGLIDLLPDAVVVYRENKILHVNKICELLLGLDSPQSLLGCSIEDLLDYKPDGLTEAGSTPGDVSRPLGASRVVKQDGSVLQVELFQASINWTAGPCQLLLLRDVTQRYQEEQALQVHIDELESNLERSTAHYKEITRQLHEAKETADTASRTKSEFLANMSHELRTPLNAIMGFSEVIKNEMFGHIAIPQYVEYARDIYGSGSHLLDIINDILDLSKVEAGRFNLSEENVAIEEVVFAVCNIIKGKADEKNLHIAPRLPGIMPMLYADKRALKQMLLNLLSNAVKFTPKDGDVCISASLESNGGLAIVISDSGIGIAEADMKKVMTPFGQVDSALAREHDGTGLGVPLVKAMIELHGGTLSINSTPGKGSVVTLCFPPERSIRSEAA
jgi:PAS domain S-box-containing protein